MFVRGFFIFEQSIKIISVPAIVCKYRKPFSEDKSSLFRKKFTINDAMFSCNNCPLQKRRVAVMENGTWASTAGKQMKEILSGMKDMEIYEETVTVKSALKENQMEQLDKIVDFMTK